MALVSGSQGGAGEPATLVMGKRQAALSVTAPCSTGQKDWMTVEARFDMQGSESLSPVFLPVHLASPLVHACLCYSLRKDSLSIFLVR